MRSALSLMLAGLLALASAQQTTTTISTCTTLFGGSSALASLSTSSSTKLTTVTHTARVSTYLYTKTVTPSAVTSTSTPVFISTSYTTLAQVTDSYTSSSTMYVTSSFSTTVTTSTTVVPTTTVYSTPTYTVPTSAGFTPVASSGYYPGAKKKRGAAGARAVLSGKSVFERAKPALKILTGANPGYATSVTCKVTTEIDTTSTKVLTASRSTTITLSTSTIIAYASPSTVQSISTVVPAHVTQTTIYVYSIVASTTSTSTTTMSFTSTSTNTVSVIAPSATFYAACDASNLISSASGQAISALQVSGLVQPEIDTQPGSAYDCCVACQLNPICAISSFCDGWCSIYPIGGSDGSGGGTCNQQTAFGNYFHDTDFDGDTQTVSNGNCGRFVFGLGGCYNYNGGDC